MDIATARVSAIAQGSRSDADMEISIDKTKVMHVCPQGKVTATTATEAKKVCKHKCTHPGCNKVFHTARGAKCHAGKCRWKQYYIIDRILQVRGSIGNREFLIKWALRARAQHVGADREPVQHD